MKYLIYCRKSTDTEDKQVLSLDSQERELLEIANKHNLNVVEILRESMSAKSSGRPVFDQVLEMVSSGEADSILCWKLDRLARNFVDGGKIIDLLQRGTIKEIRTHESIHLPSDNVLMLAVQLGMANQFVRDLSTNVKRGNREKLSRGEWPNHAPFGYLNDRVAKTIVIDNLKEKYVRRSYELYLQGKSYQEISDILYSDGLRTSAGKKVFKSQIQRIITNPFYTGLMVRDGKYYNGKHQPIVSKTTFDRAQEVSSNRSRPRSKDLFFPLRGFMNCENCGCALTASLKKGHHYYYCTNRKEKCEEHKSYMREIYLYEIFGNILGSLAFSERKIELMYQAAREKMSLDTDYLDNIMDTIQSTLESLKTKEARLLDTFIDEQISKELYDQKTLALQNERVSLNKQLQELKQRKPAFVLEPTKEIFLRCNRAKTEFLKADDFKKHKIVESLCWNLSFLKRNVAQVKLKSPYDVLYKADKNASISTLLPVRDSNPN